MPVMDDIKKSEIKKIINCLNKIYTNILRNINESSYIKITNDFKTKFANVKQKITSQVESAQNKVVQKITEIKENHNKDIKDINQKCSTISKNLKNKITDIEDIDNANKKVAKNIKSAKGDVKCISSIFDKVRNELNKIKNINDTTNWESLNDNLSKCEKEANNNKKKVNNLQESNTNSRTAKKKDIRIKRKQIKELTEDINVHNQELDKLKGAFKTIKDNRDKTTISWEDVKTEITRLNKFIKEYNSKVEEYDKQMKF